MARFLFVLIFAPGRRRTRCARRIDGDSPIETLFSIRMERKFRMEKEFFRDFYDFYDFQWISMISYDSPMIFYEFPMISMIFY